MRIRIFFWGAVLLLLLLVAMMVFAVKASAQTSGWGNCTNGICYTGGRVGIGTLAPATGLDVNGHVKSIANSGGATFVVTPNVGGQSYGQTAANGFHLGRTAGPGNGISGPDFFISTTGKVGIGTASPTANLQVNGSFKSISNSGGSTNVVSPNGAGKSYGMATVGGNGFYFGETAGPGSGISSPKFRVYDNGDVCIGSCQ